MLIKRLDQLGADKRQLETRIQRTPPPMPLGETDEIIAAISDTIDGLTTDLQADEAEAARAKELLRGLVSRIVLTPVGPQKDGRGAGDIRVTVEGPIANLIDLSDLSIDRVTKNGHRPMFELDNANLVWTFSYELKWEDTRLDVVRLLSLIHI